MRETYRIGNAQSIGSRQVQSNYFSAKIRRENECLAVLSDGTIDHINGRRCAVLAAEACMREWMYLPREADITAFFDVAAARILKDMRELLYLGKTPYLSLSIQYLKDGQMFYYTAGSNRLFLFDGMDVQMLAHAARTGCVEFKKGMTAGMLSHGAWEALREKEIACVLRAGKHPYEKAQQMLLHCKEKNRKAAGNATVLLVEGCL